jgi:hypothetical protein
VYPHHFSQELGPMEVVDCVICVTVVVEIDEGIAILDSDVPKEKKTKMYL